MNLEGTRLGKKASPDIPLAKRSFVPMLVWLGLTLLAACSKTKEVPVTRVVVETRVKITVQTVVQRVKVTPTPEFTVVEDHYMMVICIGQEPETLYRYGGSSLAQASVFEAIYDGPIDSNSYGFQPVILEKLPSPADGDAIVKEIMVQAGDLVVGDDDYPVSLEQGVRVRPAGCYNPQCTVEFDGDPITMDQIIVTYTLKAGILWSDGEPLTAHDSVYAFELAQDPDTPAYKYVIDRSASYEAVDDHTVVWISLPGYTTLPPDPLCDKISYATNFWPPLPKHAWGHLSALELLEAKESTRKPLGWGPYVIEEWTPGSHIALIKNENYWRAGEGLPKFYYVTLRFTGQDANDNIANILSGKCDIADQTARLYDQGELLLALQEQGLLYAAFTTGTVWERADFGIVPIDDYQRPDFFGDVRTRQAIAMCMDRQAIVDELTFGQSVVMHTYVPPQHPLYNLDVRQYPFDPEAGSALLEEVGWIDNDSNPYTPRIAQSVQGVPDSTPLEFNYWTTSVIQRQQVVQALQHSLTKCGIEINPQYRAPASDIWEIDDLKNIPFGHRFDMAQLAWLSSVEPPCNLYTTDQIPGPLEHGYLYGWIGNNVTGWSNREYDAACQAALQLLPGMPGYEQFHHEAQRIFAEQLPAVPLYLQLKVAAARPDMRGFIMDPTAHSEMWNIEEFDY